MMAAAAPVGCDACQRAGRPHGRARGTRLGSTWARGCGTAPAPRCPCKREVQRAMHSAGAAARRRAPNLELNGGLVHRHGLRQESGADGGLLSCHQGGERAARGRGGRSAAAPRAWKSKNWPFTKRSTRLDLPAPMSPSSTCATPRLSPLRRCAARAAAPTPRHRPHRATGSRVRCRAAPRSPSLEAEGSGAVGAAGAQIERAPGP